MLKEPKNAQFHLPGGAAIPDDENAWSRETSLRGDLLILEQIEALEDRVASASMQTKVCKRIKLLAMPSSGEFQKQLY